MTQPGLFPSPIVPLHSAMSHKHGLSFRRTLTMLMAAMLFSARLFSQPDSTKNVDELISLNKANLPINNTPDIPDGSLKTGTAFQYPASASQLRKRKWLIGGVNVVG